MGYTPPYLNVRKVAGGYSVDPGGVTTDDLTILPNVSDSYPAIILEGSAAAPGVIKLNGSPITITYGGTAFLSLSVNGTDTEIIAAGNNDLLLKSAGTGKVKFGTFTGSGDVAVNGSISILDSGGTARKLATVA